MSNRPNWPQNEKYYDIYEKEITAMGVLVYVKCNWIGEASSVTSWTVEKFVIKNYPAFGSLNHQNSEQPPKMPKKYYYFRERKYVSSMWKMYELWMRQMVNGGGVFYTQNEGKKDGTKKAKVQTNLWP